MFIFISFYNIYFGLAGAFKSTNSQSADQPSTCTHPRNLEHPIQSPSPLPRLLFISSKSPSRSSKISYLQHPYPNALPITLLFDSYWPDLACTNSGLAPSPNPTRSLPTFTRIPFKYQISSTQKPIAHRHAPPQIHLVRRTST